MVIRVIDAFCPICSQYYVAAGDEQELGDRAELKKESDIFFFFAMWI